MIITRKKKIPPHWLFYAQLPLVLSIYGGFVINTPFLLVMKRFIDNPAAILGLISIEFYVTWLGGPFISWLSDRIWTRFGRRKFFFVIADAGKGLILLLMPLAPNLWVLIILRWIYGAVGDFGSMTQALIYETVPPPQRGKGSGIFSSCMQFGNLIFYFLLIGRFDDLYFMGPFSIFTRVSGGAMMFLLAAMLLLGIAFFEGLGFKEIKPPNLKLLNDERESGTSLFKHFVKTFLKDVLAKDFLPLYLFMFINVMFGVGLGVFQPLLFTEQWGYSLQDMGNTIAVGVITTVTFSLIAGWFADKFGKLQTFLVATILSFCMSIFYTIFVYLQPDYRPSLLQIILIGNVSAAIGMVKGVVTFPLMMEYVRRNRMGAANAGMGLFGSLIRNMITLFVGVWLVWWSVWFHPQAGYNMEATFPESLDREELASTLQEGGVNMDNLILRPLHQYGIDGTTSSRWWVHRNDKPTRALLKERKDLTNEIAPIETRLDSPLLSQEKRMEFETRVAEIQTRLDEIADELDHGVQTLRAQIFPVLQDQLFYPGDQILSLQTQGPSLDLTLRTIEALPGEQLQELTRVLDGPQYRVIPANGSNGNSRWRQDLSVTPQTDPEIAIRFQTHFDDTFLKLFSSLVQAGRPSHQAFSNASVLTSVLRADLGRQVGAWNLKDLSVESTGDTLRLRADIRPRDAIEDPERLANVLRDESLVSAANISSEEAGYLMELSLTTDDTVNFLDDRARARRADLQPRLHEELAANPVAIALVTETVLRLTDALASKPFYITVPEHTPRSSYQDREYEYFFSSQTLMILTDLIGFCIVAFLIAMEKKGVVHRAGAEEDLNR